jgi:hypothetical protein
MEENLTTDLDEEFEDDFSIDDTDDTEVEDVDADIDTDTDTDEVGYDDDGNVIIEEQTDDTETETQEEVAAQTDTAEEDKTDTEYAKLKKEFDNREALIKDALKKMGIDEDDVEKAILRLGAEAEGITPEEYGKEIAEKRRKEEAERVYAQVMLEKKIADDIAALRAEFPEMKDVTKLEQIPNARRFAELRDAGLTAREAYVAANFNAQREAIAASVRQAVTNSSKDHLVSNVPRASKDTSTVKISRADMEQLRDLFPDKSDKEIIALYKKTK